MLLALTQPPLEYFNVTGAWRAPPGIPVSMTSSVRSKFGNVAPKSGRVPLCTDPARVCPRITLTTASVISVIFNTLVNQTVTVTDTVIFQPHITGTAFHQPAPDCWSDRSHPLPLASDALFNRRLIQPRSPCTARSHDSDCYVSSAISGVK